MRPHPKRSRTNPRAPEAWGTSDRSGFVGQHKKLRFQYQWAGTDLINTRMLVHPDEYDEPQRQLATIILPPDPEPVLNARPEQYAIDQEPVSTRYTMDGKVRIIFGHGAAFVVERIVAVRGNLPPS